MKRTRRIPSRAAVVALLVSAAVAAPMLAERLQVTTAAQGSTFSGGNPSPLDAKAVRTLRLRFPAGSRSNWHSHSHGQLLMVEQGGGRTQERGGLVLEIGPGRPWFTAAGVEHWHGAAPDQDMIQLTIYEGDVKWLEPVTDEVYRAAAKR